LDFLLIISSPRVLGQLLGIARASNSRGHKVTIFFNEDSVKLLLNHDLLKGLEAEMLACATACEFSGLKEKDFVEGARMTSLGEVITIMERSARTLFLG
jgi:predicted peroxiredoxin